jgi:hypothetical protein
LNIWKNKDAWMMETCPDSGLSDVKELKVGIGYAGAVLCGGTGSRIEGSNISPAMNGTGNVLKLDLKSSCPKSQNSMLWANHQEGTSIIILNLPW